MYRKVTTLISFAAFILFWIIMCPLGMYGQESKWVDMNPVRKRYLRFHKDFAVDSVKYPIWEYQNSVIFANSGVTLQFKKGGPFFYTDQSPLHKGYLQPIITQYFIDNKSEIWLLFLIAHSKR